MHDHDSTKYFFFKNIEIKLSSRTWMSLKSLVVIFQALEVRTSAASMTSTASTTSVASMTSTASFHQRTSWTWLLDHPWYQNDQYWSLFEEWIIKNPVFYWYLIPFLLEAVEVNLYCFFEKWLQISNYHNLRHLQNTLFLWNYLSWYLLEPNYFVHFNVRHPVRN